jgi:hypothetical protein
MIPPLIPLAVTDAAHYPFAGSISLLFDQSNIACRVDYKWSGKFYNWSGNFLNEKGAHGSTRDG